MAHTAPTSLHPSSAETLRLSLTPKFTSNADGTFTFQGITYTVTLHGNGRDLQPGSEKWAAAATKIMQISAEQGLLPKGTNKTNFDFNQRTIGFEDGSPIPPTVHTDTLFSSNVFFATVETRSGSRTLPLKDVIIELAKEQKKEEAEESSSRPRDGFSLTRMDSRRRRYLPSKIRFPKFQAVVDSRYSPHQQQPLAPAEVSRALEAVDSPELVQEAVNRARVEDDERNPYPYALADLRENNHPDLSHHTVIACCRIMELQAQQLSGQDPCPIAFEVFTHDGTTLNKVRPSDGRLADKQIYCFAVLRNGHWIGGIINRANNTLYYFNSTVPDSIVEEDEGLLSEIAHGFLNNGYVEIVNIQEHSAIQRDNYSCGIYVLDFIRNFALGESRRGERMYGKLIGDEDSEYRLPHKGFFHAPQQTRAHFEGLIEGIVGT